MKVITKIRVEKTDRARLEQIDNAYNLVGGREHAYELLGGALHDETNAFGRLRGNDFSYEDVEVAVALIKARRTMLYEKAAQPSGLVFQSADGEEVYANGVRFNADLAVREAEQFQQDVLDDLGETDLIIMHKDILEAVREAEPMSAVAD